MDLNKQRGSRIESLRASKGISQLELAKMLGYKSDSTISKWESGASIPTGTKIVKLAQALGTSTDYILFGNGPETTDEPQQPNDHDIDEIIANAMMFDGKPLTEDDKRAIRGIIAGYMSSKGE
ncbi:helix-turn-helix domain-containing protein [Streptococcus salivarius]|uniref:helix-turn-helix domain-containing protein n=1 Tax=Streptococcus salivarius TaxID=1304 RepID=UPI001BDB1FEF|nr:helix-turn-helix transcriptional regulator [Streptococcus salivarius]MBT0940082.1 helix-turn-helix domain-containing protein [Streptococcus salivarius]